MPTDMPSANQQLVRKMTRYMAWANGVVLDCVADLPDAEIRKPRPSVFGSIAHTFNHLIVVEKIFQAHLEGTSHPFTARNTETVPPFADIRAELERMDRFYIDLADQWRDDELDEVIEFTFVGGGEGSMTRMEILLHLVNHATYHRGNISEMLVGVAKEADFNDFTVFLRDAWPGIQARM